MRFADLPAPPAHPLQSLVEFGALWDLAASRDTRRVVEVGSLYGGTLWYWTRLPLATHVISVDLLPAHEPIRSEVAAAREGWSGWTLPRACLLTTYDADSHDPALVAHTAKYGPFDLLFLDGDHTYEGVAEDFRLWSPHVREGGLIAFHDTVVNGTRDEPGVRKFVEELKRTWRWLSIEFFEPDGAGITAFTEHR